MLRGTFINLMNGTPGRIAAFFLMCLGSSLLIVLQMSKIRAIWTRRSLKFFVVLAFSESVTLSWDITVESSYVFIEQEGTAFFMASSEPLGGLISDK